METWKLLVGIFLGAIVLGCSETNNSISQSDELIIRPVDYYVVLSNSIGIYTKNIASTSEGLSLTDTESFQFTTSASSQLFRDGFMLMSYQNTDDCGGNLVLYDLKDRAELSLPIFSDLSSCQLSVTAITGQANMIFLSYVVTMESKEQSFFVRGVDLDTSEYEDYEFNKKPIKLVASDSRLYVLTSDENLTEKNALTVFDFKENTEMLEMDLGFDVGTIFKKANGDIVVSYPNSHTILDSKTLEASFTRYASGSQPHFYTSENNSFDANGNMYYVRKDSLTEQNETITAMHDFDKNSTVLYYFENFLNEAQVKVEYDIKSATTVSFDNANNLILIGYEKNLVQGGGIIRITPAPNLKFVDNLVVADVPFLIVPDN